MWSQDQKVHFLENKDGAKGLYIHDWLTDRAVDFIHAAKEDTRPFFLYLAYTLPHSDLAVPDDQVLRGDGPNAVFAAMVERLDKDIGRLRDYLRELELADNTLVIFTADNGPHSQQGKSNDYFRASYPHRGEKRDLLEGGIRVPFLAVWPGSIVPGSRSAHVSAFWDFMPTACDLLGIAPPEGIDGISYLPALLGMPNRQHTYLYWEFLHKNDARQAIRFGDWKLLIQGNVGPQLFHLPTDPAEMRDLGDSYPVIRSALLEALPHLREPHPLFPFTPRF
ncbi:MAG: sulfatase-like hydrolase/transferase [Verrucomicrobia bacterium]|nr:sulfatase-like hydrolase/transferase [Verrucomicrobiota bacterium]